MELKVEASVDCKVPEIVVKCEHVKIEESEVGHQSQSLSLMHQFVRWYEGDYIGGRPYHRTNR